MTITRLVRSAKNQRKIAIYVDSKYTFSVLENVVLSESLYVGKEVSQEYLEQLKRKGDIGFWKDKTIDLIARRPRSLEEIRSYLAKKTDEQMVNQVILELQALGYLDDRKFALWWFEQRVSFGSKSMAEIRAELIKKGISIDIIAEIVDETDTEQIEIENVLKLIERKERSLKNKSHEQHEIRQKLIQYLQRKGFGWGVIKSALDRSDY